MFDKTSAIISLYDLLKAMNTLSNISSSTFEIIWIITPSYSNELTLFIYEIQKILSWVGMDYENIYVCSDNCILYRKEHDNTIECLLCNK